MPKKRPVRNAKAQPLWRSARISQERAWDKLQKLGIFDNHACAEPP